MDFGTGYYKDVKVITGKLLKDISEIDIPVATLNFSKFNPSVFVNEETQLVFKQSNTGCTIGELLASLNYMHNNFTPLVESNNHNAELIEKIMTMLSPGGILYEDIKQINPIANKLEHSLLDITVLKTRVDEFSTHNKILSIFNVILSLFIIFFFFGTK